MKMNIIESGAGGGGGVIDLYIHYISSNKKCSFVVLNVDITTFMFKRFFISGFNALAIARIISRQ